MRFGTVLKISVVLIVALVVAIVVVVSSIDFNQYKGLIAQKVKEATGRDLHIEGDLDLALSFSPAVVANGVSFSNAPWGSRPQMVTMRRFEAEMALLPLITGDFQVKRLVLIEPDILVETDDKGRGNWEFGRTSQEHAQVVERDDGHVPAVDITEVRIEKALLTYRDGVSGQTVTLGIERLSAHADDFGSPITLDLAAAYNGNTFGIAGTVGALSKLMNNESFPIKVTVKAGGAEATVDGSVARPMQGKGVNLAITMKTDSLAGLSGLAGVDLPALGPIRVAAKVLDRNGAYMVKELKALVGNSDLSGEVTVALGGKRPKVSATLTSTLINLADFSLSSGAASGKGAKDKKRIFPANPLPLDGLRLVDADVTLKAERIRTQAMVLEQVDVALNLKGGRLSVKLVTAQLAGGTLSADMTLDAAGKTARLSTNLIAKEVEMGRLLEQVQVKDVMSGGKTDIQIRLNGRGNSIRTLMAGLNGRILVVMGKGQIHNSAVNLVGADLVMETIRMMNPFAEKDEYTSLQCGVVRFDVRNGIATTDKGIAAETRKMSVIGSGTINLKTEELDLGIHSEALEGIGVSAGSLAKLVRLGGTLAEPKLEPDTVGILKKGATIGAAVATGGLSLLAEGLFSLATNKSPCVTALGKVSAKTADSGVSQPPTSTQKKKGGVLGLLEGFFGK